MTRLTSVAGWCAAAALFAAVLLPASASGAAPSAATAADPVRILIVGDSVTQGSAGDWTWRYRLWQHFARAGVPVDFVGPRSDLYDNVTTTFDSTAYADPAFDTDHAARWGMWAGTPDIPIGDLVATYHPDVVVEMLGVNDVLFGAAPSLVASQIAGLARAARAVEPDVSVVLAEETERWFQGVPELDDALPAVAASLDRPADAPAARAVVATTSQGYDAAPDTWDNSHPNARGEVLIAAAVADALHTIGVGPAATRPLVMPEVGPRVPGVLGATAGDRQAHLSWTDPPGATAEVAWVRDVTARDAWAPRDVPLTGGVATLTELLAGHAYAFRLQPMKGDDRPEGTVFSNVATVAVGPAPPPATGPRAHLSALRGLRARAGRGCVALSWRAVSGASSYLVQRRVAGRWRARIGTRHHAIRIRRLPATRRWVFRVTPRRAGTTGRPATIAVRPGKPWGCG